MTDHNSKPETPAPPKTPELGSKGEKTQGTATIAKEAPIETNTVSNALRAVLQSQGRIAELVKTTGRQNLATRDAIETALAPSRLVKTALDNLPGSQMEKALQALPSAQLEKALQTMPSLSGHFGGRHPTPSILSKAQQRDGENTQVLDDVAKLGRAIRNARKNRQLTQQKFADLAGVGRRFVSDLEGGKQTLEIGKVLKVTAAAGIRLTFVSTDSSS